MGPHFHFYGFGDECRWDAPTTNPSSWQKWRASSAILAGSPTFLLGLGWPSTWCIPNLVGLVRWLSVLKPRNLVLWGLLPVWLGHLRIIIGISVTQPLGVRVPSPLWGDRVKLTTCKGKPYPLSGCLRYPQSNMPNLSLVIKTLVILRLGAELKRNWIKDRKSTGLKMFLTASG